MNHDSTAPACGPVRLYSSTGMTDGLEPVDQRLPWATTGAAILAFIALYYSGRSRFDGVALMGTVLVAAAFIHQRLPASLVLAWFLRITIFAAIIVLGPPRRRINVSAAFEPDFVHYFGYLLMAELLLRVWQYHKQGPPPGDIMVLTGLIFMSATNTMDTHHIPWLAPPFMILMGLSLRDFQRRGQSAPSHRTAAVWRQWSWRGGAIAVMIGLGLGGSLAVASFGPSVERWAMVVLANQYQGREVGMSGTAQLGAVYNPAPSPQRVMRIANFHGGDAHLRGLVFDAYRYGNWGPSMRARQFFPAPPNELGPLSIGQRAAVNRYDEGIGLIYAPLDVAGVVPRDDLLIEWNPADGMALREEGSLRQTRDYDLVFPRPDERRHTPLNQPPDDAQRPMYLRIPEELDPVAAPMAEKIAPATLPPIERARAIERSLRANHAYSLTVNPGEGDPVTSFLRGEIPGHCQYFASAAVMLLRSAGIPARMVTGFYAHEREPNGDLTVRQRDAHAWAEAFVDDRWVMIDATPSGGRPDELFPRISQARRIGEWLSDLPGLIWRWATNLELWQLGLAGALMAAGFGTVALIQRYRRRAPGDLPYDQPDLAMRQLGRRFEQLLKRAGLEISPRRTWRQHLGAADAAYGRFVDRYDEARFGEFDPERFNRLESQLRQLEQSPASAKSAIVSTKANA